MKAIKGKVKTSDPSAVPFSDIRLSKPAQRALAGKVITTLKQLSKFTEEEILSLHGIGKTAIPVLKASLKAAELSFRKKNVSPLSKKKPGSVDEYLASLPPDAGSTLETVRKAIISAAPEAEENISYESLFTGLTVILLHLLISGHTAALSQ